MENSFLVESDILVEIFVAGGGALGAFISALSVFYYGITKRDKQSADSFLLKLDLDFSVMLHSLVSLSIQYQAYERTIYEQQKLHTNFTPFEFNPFEYLKEDWDVSHNAFNYNKELAENLHAFARSLATLSLFAQRTHKRIDAVNQKYENHNINAQQATQLYENILKRDKPLITEMHQTIGHGFVLWAQIRNKNEDPLELYEETRNKIIKTAQEMYEKMKEHQDLW